VDGLLDAYAQRELEFDDLGAFCGVLLRNWQGMVAGRRGALMSLLQSLLPERGVRSVYEEMELAIDERGMLTSTRSTTTAFSVFMTHGLNTRGLMVT
jgi:hypothetical protein